MGIVRLLLAVCVVVMHVNGDLSAGFFVEASMAVKLFYIISGFYMALILTEKYTGPNAVWLFLSNRFLRLLPTYYLLLLLPVLAMVGGRLFLGRWLAFGGLGVWLEQAHQMDPVAAVLLAVSNLTVIGQELTWSGVVEAASGRWVWTSDYFAAGMIPGFFFLEITPSWTLGVELEFYCLAPFLAALRTTGLLAAICASLACRFFLAWLFPVLSGLWQNHFLPCELIYFLAGMASYRVFGRLRASGRLPLMATCGRIVLPALLALFGLYPFLPESFRGLLVAVALALALPFVFALTAEMKADRALGELSYPLYLAHWNLCYVWSLLVREGWVPKFRHEWISALLFVVVALAVAAALVAVVEIPMNRFRERRRLARSVPSPA